MNIRDDFYSKEAALINSARRELVNGLDKDPIYKLRLMCFAKGATGLLVLARNLRKMDKNLNDSISYEEFAEGFKESGFDWNQNDVKILFENFDDKQNHAISITAFINKLRPSIAGSRLTIINKAFEKVDNNSDGIITLGDLKNAYCVRDHPKYLSGDLTEAEILEQFLDNFDDSPDDKRRQTKITKEEFINYYATISAAIDNDAYFDLVMRRAYKL